jgi:hypothetical protein
MSGDEASRISANNSLSMASNSQQVLIATPLSYCTWCFCIACTAHHACAGRFFSAVMRHYFAIADKASVSLILIPSADIACIIAYAIFLCSPSVPSSTCHVCVRRLSKIERGSFAFAVGDDGRGSSRGLMHFLSSYTPDAAPHRAPPVSYPPVNQT